MKADSIKVELFAGLSGRLEVAFQDPDGIPNYKTTVDLRTFMESPGFACIRGRAWMVIDADLAADLEMLMSAWDLDTLIEHAPSREED